MKMQRFQKPAWDRTVLDHPDFQDFLVAAQRAALHCAPSRPMHPKSRLRPTYPKENP